MLPFLLLSLSLAVFVQTCFTCPYKYVLTYKQMANYTHPNFVFTVQTTSWTYMDAFLQKLDLTLPPNRILLDVMKVTIEKYEENMEKINSLAYFWEYIQKETKGYVADLPMVVSHTSIDIPEELQPFLKTLGQQTDNPLGSLPEKYAQNALAHFQKYSIILKKCKSIKGLRELFRSTGHQASPTAYYARRLEIFKSSIKGVTANLDFILTPIRLASSWSLAQYLKYMSRLFPQYHKELRTVMDHYFDVLDAFITRRSTIDGTLHVFPLASAVEKHGVRFTEVLVEAVPCQEKLCHDYHCVGIRMPTRTYASDQDCSILMYATENSVNDQERISKIIDSAIAQL